MSGGSVTGKAAVRVAGGVPGVAALACVGGACVATDSACPGATLLRVKRQVTMTIGWLSGFHIMRGSPEK